MGMQTARSLGLTTPLAEDALRLVTFRGSEGLGRLFKYDLKMASDDGNIGFDDVVGQTMTVRLDQGDGPPRYLCGVVSRFVLDGSDGGEFCYQATLRPWLWTLTQNRDSRIFQHRSVPDIVKQVFRDQGFADFEERLSESYDPREYCVQYRESDFAFVSRLLEEEGIYYYFRHEESRHVLVLADHAGAHDAVPPGDEIPFVPRNDDSGRIKDHVFEWTMTQRVGPGRVALNDFDFTRPRADLESRRVSPRPHAHSDAEIYDYPGEYTAAAAGERYARLRLEEQQHGAAVAEAATNARGLATGYSFQLTDYPREDQNREYLVIAAEYEFRAGEYSSGTDADEDLYSCRFKVIPRETPFRSSRTTPIPIIAGPQTAIVVGQAGEEIWTDEYGRIKVQFHWDRVGVQDEASSAWIRVAQMWAGPGFGSVFLPRIGQEVIVEFLEGDPDRPIITGRVYNGDNMPPYPLPDDKSVSGIRSRSTPGGSPQNFNEIKLDDRKGEELFFVQAEKDREVLVKNDNSECVGGNEAITIGKNQKLKVGAASMESVALGKALSVGGGYQISVGGVLNETVGGAKMEEIGAYRLEAVAGYKTTQVGEKLSVDAGDEIELKSGDSSLTMTKDGKIEIAGTDVTLRTAAGEVHIDAGGIITIKGAMVKINS